MQTFTGCHANALKLSCECLNRIRLAVGQNRCDSIPRRLVAQTQRRMTGAVVDIKTARLRMLRLAQQAPNTPQAQPRSQVRDDAHWFQHYGQHLGRLLEPVGTLPADLEQLVSAIAAKAARPHS